MKQLAIGVMSGTSLDGIDIALCAVDDASVEFLHGATYSYDKSLENKIRHCMDETMCTAALISSVHFELAVAYANAIKEFCSLHNIKLEDVAYIACHGQTIYHINETTDAFHQSSLQLGDGSVLSTLLDVTVVSNFRNADIAVGGCGAPLVPYADYVMFRNTEHGVALHNIGGIANLTVIEAGATINNVLAFDTGPGNMMIDEAMRQLFHQPFDTDGMIARSGMIFQPLLEELMNHSFFSEEPPKSTGREQFGQQFTLELLHRYQQVDHNDLIRTLSECTVLSIANAYKKWVLPNKYINEIIVSGGGAQNQFLIERIQEELPDITVVTSDEKGVNSNYKEAIAFALLGYETLHQRPSNVPSATGASRAVILGQISYGNRKVGIK